jgi:hypothetical protein
MPRLDGDTFLFGTAMTAYSWFSRMAEGDGLIEERHT